MKICLDIDNTLLNYEPLFFRTANNIPNDISNLNDLKDILKSRSHEEWISVQGKCYGELIDEVELFSGALKFLKDQLSNNHQVTLVSHKTQSSYCGSYDNLREKTISRLRKLGVVDLIGIENIHFADSLESKIKKIKSLTPHLIVDDLLKVTEHIELKAIPYRIHLSDYSTNSSLSSFSWEQINHLTSYLAKTKAKIQNVYKTGRNSVLKVSINNHPYILKVFALKDRYKREKSFLLEFDQTPEPVLCNDLGYFIVMEFIEGKSPTIFDTEVKKTLKEFWSKETNTSATHRRTKIEEYLKHIENRFSQSKSHHKSFKELHENLIKRTETVSYKPEYESLCTPDLSLDNFIQSPEGRTVIIDLESAGMDDPLRSLANGLFHSRSALDNEQMIDLIKFFVETYPGLLSESFEIIMDLVAFDWLLLERDPKKSLARQETYQKRMEDGIIPYSLPDEVREYVQRIS